MHLPIMSLSNLMCYGSRNFIVRVTFKETTRFFLGLSDIFVVKTLSTCINGQIGITNFVIRHILLLVVTTVGAFSFSFN